MVGCTLCGVQCPGVQYRRVKDAAARRRLVISPRVCCTPWHATGVQRAVCPEPVLAQTPDQRSRPAMVAHWCARARCTLVVLALTVSSGAAQDQGVCVGVCVCVAFWGHVRVCAHTRACMYVCMFRRLSCTPWSATVYAIHTSHTRARTYTHTHARTRAFPSLYLLRVALASGVTVLLCGVMWHGIADTTTSIVPVFFLGF